MRHLSRPGFPNLNVSGALCSVKQDNLAVAIPGAFAPDGSQAFYGTPRSFRLGLNVSY
ncbi:hypothetical protein [Cupriavidus basilensis]|uniref:hypothetical protein n=1 Tax=Cupriavidus basilensis TaxID=68895 RepID=UPI0003137B9F|nr:hypothetical protein [Cupriavidus basilensis]